MKPSKGLIQALFVWLILALALVSQRFYAHIQEQSIEQPILYWLCFGYLITLIAVALFDAMNRKYLDNLTARRIVPNSIPVASNSKISIQIENHSEQSMVGQVFDHYPDLITASITDHSFQLAPEQKINFEYNIKAHTRGDAHFGDIQLIIESPLRLWQWNKKIPTTDFIRVYPNFSQISHFNMLAGEHNLAEMGIHLRQLRGQGMEFHQLRNYRKGDSLRQIDWGATSRKQQLISRDYQEERDQQIIFLIDCGKRMRTKDDEISHFDHTLNALLLLAYVALKQDDAVGFQTFGGQNRGIMPIKGQQQINTLLNQLYDVHPTLTASDYLQAAQNLISKTKKRALIVLVSNMRDSDVPELEPAIKLLQRHHLVLLANLKERILTQLQEEPVTDFNSAITFAETELFLQQRHKLLNYFQAKGVVTLDSTPEQLPAHLVNQYYNIKRSGRL